MSFETMLVMGQWRGEIKHRCHWKLESCKQEQLVQLPLQFSFSITQLELSLLLSHRYDYITRTSGSEALSPKRSTWFSNFVGCSFIFCFLYGFISFFLASRHEWRCTQKGKKIFLLSSILQALTTSIGSQKLASLTLPGQISILNRFFSSQSKAAVLKETSISLGIMEAVLKMQVGSPQLPQIVTGRENIRNQPHCTVNWRPILPSNAQVRENEGSW